MKSARATAVRMMLAWTGDIKAAEEAKPDDRGEKRDILII